MIRAYLRASTDKQDASRSKTELKDFVQQHNQRIACFYQENISGTTPDRPELNRLLSDSERGDVLLIEKVDRLTRLPFALWEELKSSIKNRGVHIVVVDQPMTHQALVANDDSVSAIQQALTNFMLDLAAAMARDDYETRQKRTQQGIQKAKAAGRYRGRPVDQNTVLKCKTVKLLVDDGDTVSSACKAQRISRASYYNWLKALEQAA
ncbi:recombinase family protein [Vibrio fluvialis]|nr:recombinase family protein [Vibrio fluvialis]